MGALKMGVAQNSRVRVTQVLVFASIYHGAIVGGPFVSHRQIVVVQNGVPSKRDTPKKDLPADFPAARLALSWYLVFFWVVSKGFQRERMAYGCCPQIISLCISHLYSISMLRCLCGHRVHHFYGVGLKGKQQDTYHFSGVPLSGSK